MVDAAKTTAYCWRNFWLVKSTFAVSFTASLSLPMVQAAALAQLLAREDMGSRVEVGSSLIDPPLRLLLRSLSHSCRAVPLIRSQALSLVEGDGVGVGAAKARAARSTVAVCTAVTAAAVLST